VFSTRKDIYEETVEDASLTSSSQDQSLGLFFSDS